MVCVQRGELRFERSAVHGEEIVDFTTEDTTGCDISLKHIGKQLRF